MSKDIIELKKEILSILNEILNFTESRTFKPTEEYADKYIEYINARQVYFDKLNIVLAEVNSSENTSTSELDSINNEIKSIANKIFKLDVTNKAIAEKILPIIKHNLRDSKINSKIFLGYNNTAFYENIALKFDSKQ